MRFRMRPRGQSGLTLIEVTITIGIFSILALATIASMTAVTKQSISAFAKRDQEATWFIAQKQLSSAVVNMSALLFNTAATYGPPASAGRIHSPIDQHRITTFLTDGRTVTTALADVNNPRRVITRINNSDLRGESSFLDGLVSPAMSSGFVDVTQDSFTLRRDEVLMDTNGSMNTRLKAMFASRCLPIATTPLHSSGSTIDPNAPYKSAVYAFNVVTRVPFLNSRVTSSGRSVWVSCCPRGTPCTDDNLHNFYLRTYMAVYQNNRLIAVNESPAVGETNSVWGVGFMLRFNDRSRPSRYDMMMFSARDLCKVTQVDRCMNLNPLVVKKSPSTYQTYLQTHFPIRPMLLSGSITPDLASSGVMRLTQ